MFIALMIVSIGLMYSAPKVALKDRFLLKALSIALAMMLCTILGYSVIGIGTHMITPTCTS